MSTLWSTLMLKLWLRCCCLVSTGRLPRKGIIGFPFDPTGLTVWPRILWCRWVRWTANTTRIARAKSGALKVWSTSWPKKLGPSTFSRSWFLVGLTILCWGRQGGAPFWGLFSGPKEKPMSRFHTGNRETLRRSDKAMKRGCFFGWCGSVVKAIFSNGWKTGCYVFVTVKWKCPLFGGGV